MIDLPSLSKRFDLPTRWAAFVGFLGLLIIALATVGDVLMRWLFAEPIYAVDDLSQLGFAIVIVACFPAGLLQGHNVTIRFLGLAVGPARNLLARGIRRASDICLLRLCRLAVHRADRGSPGERRYDDDCRGDYLAVVEWWRTIVVLICIPVQAVVLVGHCHRRRDRPGSGWHGRARPPAPGAAHH